MTIRARGRRPLATPAVTLTPDSGLHARRVLTVIQMSLAVALLVAAFTIASHLDRLLRADPGFDVAGVVGVYVSPPGDAFTARERGARYAEFYDRVLEALPRIPGIRAAGGINVLPLRPRAGWQRHTVTALGQDPQQQERNPVVNALRTSPGYFHAMGIPIIEGRELDERETSRSARVAVISANLGRRLWPGSSAVGKQLKLGPPGSSSPWATVVGVAGNVRSSALEGSDDYDLYFSYRQVIAGELNFVVKSDRSPAETIAAVTDVVQQINPHAAVFRAEPLHQLVADAVWQQRLWGTVIALFAACASLVGAVGLYALLVTTAALRGREFAIRAAIGAAPLDLLRLVMRENGWGLGVGCVGGAIAGSVAFSVGGGDLAGIGNTPLAAYAAALGTAAFLAIAASAIPLRRIVRADPAAMLRNT
jgi:hypothetical protein